MESATPDLFFDRTPVVDFRSLLKRFGPGAFASPFRSTVPLVAFVKDDWPQFGKLAVACGNGLDLSVHFEYTVAPPGVTGNPSQTDAMLMSPALTLALEAKWTEPRYETVNKRFESRVAKLMKDDPDNDSSHRAGQRGVIDAWLGLLGTRCGKPVVIEEAGDAVYQMIHRAASACSTASPPALLYVHFHPSPSSSSATTADYRQDLKQLHHLMGSPANFAFYLAEVPLQTTDAFRAIKSLPRGHRDTDISVRAALETTRLFEFGEPHLERIR